MFQKICPAEIDDNLFHLLNDQWMLVTAGTPDHCNTMTASWGGLGVLWRRDVAMCVVRPQRYTLQFMDESDYFTLSFFGDGKYRKELQLCGTKSGRDMDKIAACGFTVAAGAGNAPYFQEAELVIVCRKLYWQDLDPSHFTDPGVLDQCYPEKDYHRMYVGEIAEVLKKRD